MTPELPIFSPARRSWLRRSIYAAAAVATLVTLFYAEENWRGRRAWEHYKRERVAAGDVFDGSILEQPKVPDDQNFYKTPLLQSVGYRDLTTGTSGYKGLWLWGDARAIGSFAEGKRTVISTYHDSLRSRSEYSAPVTPLDAPADVVRLFNQSPDIEELRRASLRPFSQCNLMKSPFTDPIPNYVAIRGFVQGFTLLAKAELDSGDPESAFNDTRVILRFADALRGSPTLVSAMIRVSILGLYTQAFWDGWADQRWTDKQYEAFQTNFLSLNCFADYERALRGEGVGIRVLSEDLPIGVLLNMLQRSPSSLMDRVANLLIRAAPSGWYYQNLRVYYRNMEGSYTGLNIPGKRYDPEAGNEAQKRLEALRDDRSLFSMLSRVGIPNYVKARTACARTHAYANEAAIVSALERFRHAEGHYPTALSELSPKFMIAIPADVIGDQPLHYRVIDKGFQLYSVGIDGKDDGGVPPKDLSSSDPCDWVWMSPVGSE